MGRHDPMLSFYSVVQQRGIMLPVAVNNGKKLMVVRIVKHATMIIHLLTDANPIQSIVDVVINSGLREDITKIGYAGVVRRQAVDISPLRRVNQAIYLLPSVPVKMHSKMSISLLSALLMRYQCGQGFFQQLCNQKKKRDRESCQG